ncbi:hypothetical protein ISCGN_032540 [Ixodes scapularis]
MTSATLPLGAQQCPRDWRNAPAQRVSWEPSGRPPWSRRYRRLPRHNRRRRLTDCDYCLSEFRPHYGHHVRAHLCRSCADVVNAVDTKTWRRVRCRRHSRLPHARPNPARRWAEDHVASRTT